MKVAIACDHRGFEHKKRIIPVLQTRGCEVFDVGCDSNAACDYPDFAIPAAKRVAANEVDIAILLDSSGIGMSVCANKFRGVRAAVVHDEVMARVAREANHCNVLCIGTDLVANDHLIKIVEVFLDTPFSEGRHVKRIEKILDIERGLLG